MQMLYRYIFSVLSLIIVQGNSTISELCSHSNETFSILSDIEINTTSYCNFSGIIHGNGHRLIFHVPLFQNLSGVLLDNLQLQLFLPFATNAFNITMINVSVTQLISNKYCFIQNDISRSAFVNISFDLYSYFALSINDSQFQGALFNSNLQIIKQYVNNTLFYGCQFNSNNSLSSLFGEHNISDSVFNLCLFQIYLTEQYSFLQISDYFGLTSLLLNSSILNCNLFLNYSIEINTSSIQMYLLFKNVVNMTIQNVSIKIYGSIALIISVGSQISVLSQIASNTTINQFTIQQQIDVKVDESSQMFVKYSLIQSISNSNISNIQIDSANKIILFQSYYLLAENATNSIIRNISLFLNESLSVLYYSLVGYGYGSNFSAIGIYGFVTNNNSYHSSFICNYLIGSTLIDSFSKAALVINRLSYSSYIGAIVAVSENSSIQNIFISGSLEIVDNHYSIVVGSLIAHATYSNISQVQVHGLEVKIQSQLANFGGVIGVANFCILQYFSVNSFNLNIIMLHSDNLANYSMFGAIMAQVVSSDILEFYVNMNSTTIVSYGDTSTKSVFGGFIAKVHNSRLFNIFFKENYIIATNILQQFSSPFVYEYADSQLNSFIVNCVQCFVQFVDLHYVDHYINTDSNAIVEICQLNIQFTGCIDTYSFMQGNYINESFLQPSYWIFWSASNNDFPFLVNCVMLEYGSQPLRFHDNSVIVTNQNYLLDDLNKLIIGKQFQFNFLNISCQLLHPLQIKLNITSVDLDTNELHKSCYFDTIVYIVSFQQMSCSKTQNLVEGLCVERCTEGCSFGQCIYSQCYCNFMYYGKTCQEFQCNVSNIQCSGVAECRNINIQPYVSFSQQCFCANRNQYFNYDSLSCSSLEVCQNTSLLQLCLANSSTVCLAGFEVNAQCIDDVVCGIHLCNGNGICIQFVFTPICQCFSNNFVGPHCNQTQQQCNSDQCHGNGECIFQNNTHFCTCVNNNFEDLFCSVCLPEYFGISCNQTAVECSQELCSNHGSCNSNRACDCNSGFQGNFCETCVENYVGFDCDILQLDCNLKNCNNNGLCNQNLSCICFENFTGTSCLDCAVGSIGTKCDVNQSICDSSCWNNQSCDMLGICACSQHYNGYYCENCVSGWVGKSCNTNLAGLVIGIVVIIIVIIGVFVFWFYWKHKSKNQVQIGKSSKSNKIEPNVSQKLLKGEKLTYI